MPTSREPSVVTFLFTDVVGSTQLTDALGDEGAQEIMRIHNALMRAEVARHGGSEVKAMGDGFMIAFTSVTSALACATDAQRSIARHNQENPTREILVRMGLNAGEAIAEDEDFFGAAVIVAARISALAGAGEILTSEAVKQLGQGMRGVEYKFRGEQQLKGLRESFRIYEVLASVAERPAVAALRKPRFVGREKEMETLGQALDEVAAGPGLFMLLSGELGVGKTRLAEEVARQASTRGFRVWRGNCYGTEGAPPYVPFVEMLRQYIQDRPEDVLIDELADDAPIIARLVPEVGRRIPITADSARLPPDQERYRLLDAVKRLIETTAQRRPLLLLVGDLHWADAATSSLLKHLAPALQDARIFILATCAEENLPSDHPLSVVLAEFARLQRYRRLTLRGLSAPAVRELLTGLGDGETPEGIAQTIYDQTEGNPFFATELINHLVAEGRLIGPQGEWQTQLPSESWQTPESVRVVVQQRLATLSEDARRLFAVAAVAGKDFTYDLLETLEEVPSDALLDGLEEGVRMGTIEEVAGAAARFRFSHQLIRQTLYEELSGLRRQRLHLRVGEAMEKVAPSEVEEIAYQFSRAGNMASAEKTHRYLVLAGDSVRRTAAWEKAADYYERSLALPLEIEDSRRAELLRWLGDARSGIGDWEQAISGWSQAMAIFAKLDLREDAGWVCYSLRKLYGFRGQFAEASDVVQQGLAILGEVDSEVRSRLLAQSGFIRSAFGEVGEAERLLDESFEVAQRLDLPSATGFSAFIRGMHYLNYCRLHEAADWLTKSAEWSSAGGDPATASQASASRRHVLLSLGRLADAERGIDDDERQAQKAGSFLSLCDAKWVASETACLRGDLERAERLASELLAMVRAAHADSGLPGVLINLAYIRFLRGDWAGLEEPVVEAVSCYDKMSSASSDDPRPVQLLLRALTGRQEDARAALAGFDDFFNFEDDWTMSLGEARAVLATALAVLGEREAVSKLYEPLKDWAAQSGFVVIGAASVPQLMSRVLAMAAAGAGHPEEAEQHFETALREAEEMEAAVELAEASHWYARFLQEQGGADERANALLAAAADIWQRCGMARQPYTAGLP
jgi:class 3 adenylate cyclase/tetratricopeptide (TPR) repeat protein